MQDSNEQYRDLWGAVLAQAYKDLDYTANDRNEQARIGNTEIVRISARRFLFGDNPVFRAVCILAGIEPDRARKFALKKMEAA